MSKQLHSKIGGRLPGIFRRSFLLISFFFVLVTSLSASHFRGGTISWVRLSGNTVRFTVTSSWSGFVSNPILNFGDLTPTVTVNHAQIASGPGYVTYRGTVDHTYISAGPFTAFWTSNARVGNLINSPNTPWRLESLVCLTNGNNSSPVSSVPAVVQMASTGQSFQLVASDQEGHPSTWSFSSTLQSSITTNPPAGFTISPTGLFTYSGGIYPIGGFLAIQVRVRETAPSCGAITVIDFIVQIVSGANNTAPSCFLSGNASNSVIAGTPFSMTITGTDPEGATLNLTTSGLPAGATLSPTTGVGTLMSTFSWTPSAAQAGNTYAITVIFTDPGGLQSICSFNITVVSACTAPTITCPANIVTANDPGQCHEHVSFAATTTGTAPVTVTYSPISGSDFNVGSTTVTAIAINSCGTATCNFNVTVVDNEAPTITCPGPISVPSSSGPGSETLDQSQTSDNDDFLTNSSFSAGQSFTAGLTGPLTRIDVNISIVNTPDDWNLKVYNGNGTGGSVLNGLGQTVNISTDGINTINLSPAVNLISGNAYTFVLSTTGGSMEIFYFNPSSYSGGDLYIGNSQISNVDLWFKTYVTPSGVPVCSANVTYNVSATDNCSATVVSTPASGSSFPVGSTTVIATATDPAGNSASCSFTITVNDVTPPMITCPADVTIGCGASSGPSATGSATATDNCSAIVTFNNSGTSTACNGTITRTWTATDPSANASSCVQTITIAPAALPTMTALADITVPCGGVPAASTISFTNGLAGGCLVSGTSDPSTFTAIPGPCGGTVTETWTATDPCGRPLASVSRTITVNPTAQAAFASTANLSVASCIAPLPTSLSYTNGESGACEISGSVLSTITGNQNACGGLFTESWTFTDVCGRTSTQSRTITNYDSLAPVITCPANLSVSNDAGVCGANVTFAASATDNCSTPVITYSPASNFFNVGTTTVVATATDPCNNTASCSFTVTVNDTEIPTITCPANITVSNAAGLCNAVVTYSNTANDNCPGFSVAQTCGLPSGATFPVGATTNCFTVTDAHNNSANCSFTVTVNDTEAPVAICQNVNVNLDASGNVSVTPAMINNNSTDNCGIATLTLDNSSFTCANVGVNNVILTVTDIHNNSSTCTATVTVNDSTPPVALCQNLTYNISNGNTVLIMASDVDNGSSDGCGISSSNVSPSTFTCANEGVNTVVLTVIDNYLNSSNCQATVTITNDALVCSVIGTDATCFGNCDGSADLSVTGGCGVYTYLWSNGATTEDVTGLCAGVYIVVVTDANAHTTTCAVTISEFELVTATISCCADTFACAGDTIAIAVELGGVGPWEFVWTDGSFSYSATATASPYIIQYPVTATATISIVSVTNTNTSCAGTICGSATIGANDCYVASGSGGSGSNGSNSGSNGSNSGSNGSNSGSNGSNSGSNGSGGSGSGHGSGDNGCSDLCRNVGVLSAVDNGNGCSTVTLEVACDTLCSYKVQLCHVPPGNPNNAHTIWISSLDVASHMGHGDYLGACITSPMGSGNGSGNGNGSGGGNGGSRSHSGRNHKTEGNDLTICHIPPGNPSNAHTITISQNAWSAHQAHGDYQGPCSSGGNGNGNGGSGNGSGNGGSGNGSGNNTHVTICHIPPGNPSNAHTITVSQNAVQAHLNHGDILGPCPGAPPVNPYTMWIDVSIPCGTVSNMSNSLGLPMELIVGDSTTGITGIRILGMPECEYATPSFTITYDLCNSTCGSSSATTCGPLVAFHAGDCTQYEEAVQGPVSGNRVGAGTQPESGDAVKMVVFPNPTLGDVTIQVMCEECADAAYTLFVATMDGRVILTEEFDLIQNGWFEVVLNLAGHSAGVYNVVLQNSTQQWNYRIVKE
jgi:HYR domain/Putative Ig domain